MLDTLDAPPQKLPVTIVTGFLGSGKTTLLNYIIQNFEGYKIAVLVNEFGDINIDSQLLVKVGDDGDENTIELTNGCICCPINNDFADAVYRILTRRERIDYLIVETTGVANPLPIALTFLGNDLREFTHLDSIVTVVDAETFTPIEHYNSDVAIEQIFCGDIIILNKTDLVSEQRADKTEEFLRSVKEGARILRSERGKVPLSLLLDTNLSDPDFFNESLANIEVDSQHLNNDGFMSVSFQSNHKGATSGHIQIFGLEVQAQSQPELEVDSIWIESLLQQRQQASDGLSISCWRESGRVVCLVCVCLIC